MTRKMMLLVTACLLAGIGTADVAFAAGKVGRTADGLGCNISLPQNAAPAARCAAIRRQCGGKFYANYCGDKLMSAVR